MASGLALLLFNCITPDLLSTPSLVGAWSFLLPPTNSPTVEVVMAAPSRLSAWMFVEGGIGEGQWELRSGCPPMMLQAVFGS